MKKIPLTQGKFAIVDDDIFEYLNQFKWCAARQTCGIYYAVRGFMGTDGKQKMMRMHHCIVGQPINKNETDHINGDGLDNRKENLRNVSHIFNMANQKMHRSGEKSSRYIGVSWNKHRRKWQAEIRFNGVRKYLGLFENDLNAHERYKQELAKVA